MSKAGNRVLLVCFRQEFQIDADSEELWYDEEIFFSCTVKQYDELLALKSLDVYVLECWLVKFLFSEQSLSIICDDDQFIEYAIRYGLARKGPPWRYAMKSAALPASQLN